MVPSSWQVSCCGDGDAPQTPKPGVAAAAVASEAPDGKAASSAGPACSAVRDPRACQRPTTTTLSTLPNRQHCRIVFDIRSCSAAAAQQQAKQPTRPGPWVTAAGKKRKLPASGGLAGLWFTTSGSTPLRSSPTTTTAVECPCRISRITAGLWASRTRISGIASTRDDEGDRSRISQITKAWSCMHALRYHAS